MKSNKDIFFDVRLTSMTHDGSIIKQYTHSKTDNLQPLQTSDGDLQLCLIGTCTKHVIMLNLTRRHDSAGVPRDFVRGGPAAVVVVDTIPLQYLRRDTSELM